MRFSGVRKGWLYPKDERGLRILTVVSFVALILTSCGDREGKKDVFLKCEGKMIMTSPGFATIPVTASFFVGSWFVERDGVGLPICREAPTKIEFSNLCLAHGQIRGSIDLVAKTVHVDETLGPSPNQQFYECEAVKDLRRTGR